MTSQRSQSTVWQPARLALRLLLIAVPLAFCIFITETRKLLLALPIACLISYVLVVAAACRKEVPPPTYSTDLARLASQYVVAHIDDTEDEEKKHEDHSKSFCAIALYPFEPELRVEPGERFVPLRVGQMVEVTHESRSGWYYGHLLSEPSQSGYLSKSHVVSFAGFCQMQRMYYSDKDGKF